MSYHYGSSNSSSSSSSSNRQTGSAQGQATSAQRQPAPPGYHYMPDGSLMLDSEMSGTTPMSQPSAAPPGFHYMPDGTLMSDNDPAMLSGGDSALPIRDPQRDPYTPVPKWHMWGRAGCAMEHAYQWYIDADPAVYPQSSGDWSKLSFTDPNGMVHGIDLVFALVNKLLPGSMQQTTPDSSYAAHPGGPTQLSYKLWNNLHNNELFYQWAGSPSVGQVVAWRGDYTRDANDNYTGLSEESGNFYQGVPTPVTMVYLGRSAYAIPSNIPGLTGVFTPINSNQGPGGSIYNFAPLELHYPTIRHTFNSCKDAITAWQQGQFGDIDLGPLARFAGSYNYKEIDDYSLFFAKNPNQTGDKEIKIINSFSIDTSDIDSNGEKRNFNIIGDDGAMFSMEVLDADGNYYNFASDTWSTTVSRLNKSVIEGTKYSGFINFSNIASKTHVYTLRLFAESSNSVQTKHLKRLEIRKSDGTVDINNSIGSNSILLTKEIFQPQDLTLTISCIQPSRSSATTDTVDGEVTSGSSIVMDASYLTKKIKVGDIVSGTNITTGTTVKEVNTDDNVKKYTLSAAVAGTVADSATLTFTGPFNSMTPRYGADTGAAVITPGAKGKTASFSITATAPNGRSFILKRQPKDRDICYVREVTFGSSASPIEGENTASSTLFYRWPVDNVAGLRNGMILDPSFSTGSNATIDSSIQDYLVQTTVTSTETVAYETKVSKEIEMQRDKARQELEVLRRRESSEKDIEAFMRSQEYLFKNGSEYEEIVTTDYVRQLINGVTTTSEPSSINRKGIVTAVAGELIFNKQQVDALKDDTSVKIIGYKSDNIYLMSFGTQVHLNNLKAELTTITTATSSAVSASASIPIDNRAGIIDGVSEVSGIGIKTTTLVSSGANGVTGAGTIVVDSAQTIEDNTTLTFAGASNIVTITGEIAISGGTLESATKIYFDLEKFLECV